MENIINKLPSIGVDYDVVYVATDVHGDLNQFLYPLAAFIKDSSTKKCLIYLGDYIDRGEFDAYIYCLIMMIENSDLKNNVIFLRGNHEQIKTNPDLYTRYRTCKKIGKNFINFNGHFTYNESFVWQLFHDKGFKLYTMMKHKSDVVVFTHAPVFSYKDKFTVDVTNGVIKTSEDKIVDPNGCKLYNEQHELIDNSDAIGEFDHFTTINSINTYSKGINKADKYIELIDKDNNEPLVKNVFGHIHNKLSETNKLLPYLINGGQSIKGFCCLDIDSSYGFRLKNVVWNNFKSCNKETRSQFTSEPGFAKITLNGYTFSHTIIPVKNNEANNFNNVTSFEDLLTKMSNYGIIITQGSTQANGGVYLQQVANRLKAAMFETTIGKNYITKTGDTYSVTEGKANSWDKFVYENYTDNLDKGCNMFADLILAKLSNSDSLGKENTVQFDENKGETVPKIKLFNNVPNDIIQLAGFTNNYQGITPFEIFVNSINNNGINSFVIPRLDVLGKNEISRYWAFSENSEVVKGGYNEEDSFRLNWVLWLLTSIVLIVIVVIIVSHMISNENKIMYEEKTSLSHAE